MTKCPHCGYEEPTQNRAVRTNVMNNYVDANGKREATVNSDAKELNFSPKGQAPYTVYRKDLWLEKKNKEAAAKAAAEAAKPS